MDRKTLLAIITALTLLVLLLLVHYNQQAMAPLPEPTISATTSGPIRPSVAGILDMPENTSGSTDLSNVSNVTITPTVTLVRPTAQQSTHHTAATATPLATPKPSAMAPMVPMTPMAPAATLSWNNTLRR